MATRSKPEQNPAASAVSANSGNINQIRDILIGPFQREQEAHFARIEQALERLAGEAADQTARAEEKLQKSLEASVAALESRLGDLAKRLQQLDETSRRDLTQLATDTEAKIKEQATRIGSDLQDAERAAKKRMDEVRATLEAAIGQLRDEKTSRYDLGDYLAEIGLRLKGEPSLSALDASLQDALHGDPSQTES
jgi:DNA anti-recombination protein RmuC